MQTIKVVLVKIGMGQYYKPQIAVLIMTLTVEIKYSRLTIPGTFAHNY